MKILSLSCGILINLSRGHFLHLNHRFHTAETSPSQLNIFLMGKNKGKKPKTEGKMIGQPSPQIKKAKPSVPYPLTDSAGPATSEHDSTSHSGFIFMCSPSTKLECYQYRVFGLPSGKKEAVEEIKPGTKLFLFDFQLKLLYGIYEATSAGEMNMEPAAFAGRFPAQVKFRIFKECLPLPENSLRHIIRENYTGSKFKQELSKGQVKKLLSSFRPLTASSQPALEKASLYSRAMPSSSMRHHQLTERMPSMGVPYLSETRHSHIPPFVEPQHVSKVNALQHGYHRASAYVERLNPAIDIHSLPAAIGYYVGNSQQPTLTEGVAHGVQEPSSYSRGIEERPHDQVSSLVRRYLPTEDGISHYQVTNPESRYHGVDTNQVTNFERRFHQQLPLHREDALVYQDNVAAYNPAAPALYNNTATSVTQAQQVHIPYHGGSQYQDNNAVSYNYNPAVAAAPSSSNYTASYQVNNAPVYNTYSAAPAYNTYSAAPAYNTYSAAPASSYFTAPSSLYQDTNVVVHNSTQYSIDTSGAYVNNDIAVAYAPPTVDAPSTAQPQIPSYYYSYDSANHLSHQS